MPTANFGLPLYTTSDTAALDTLLNGQSNALDTALTNNIGYFIGTNAARLALSGGRLREGVKWYATDNDLEWYYTGTAWRISPGQILGSMYGTTSVTTASTLLGTVVTSSVALPAGQRFIVQSDAVGLFATTAGGVQAQMRWTTNGSAVTVGTGSVRDIRVQVAAAGNVETAPGRLASDTMSVANTVSAALYLINGPSGFGAYGPDGFYLQIVSA